VPAHKGGIASDGPYEGERGLKARHGLFVAADYGMFREGRCRGGRAIVVGAVDAAAEPAEAV
jgi:hypothetical protein